MKKKAQPGPQTWPLSGHDAPQAALREVRALLVGEDGQWLDDVSGADVVEALTNILDRYGYGAEER